MLTPRSHPHLLLASPARHVRAALICLLSGLVSIASPLHAQTAPVCTNVRFHPKPGSAQQMVGGRFVGSNSGPTTDFVEIARIRTRPSDSWNELSLSNRTAYRWLKYESPNGAYCLVADIQFFAGTQRIHGAGFGSAGSRNDAGNTFNRALDGNPNTYFEAPTPNDAYVGIELPRRFVTATPTANPVSGAYPNPIQLTLRSATPGATIRYTLTGATPTPSSGAIYVSPFSVTRSATVKAKAFNSNLFASDLLQASYTIGTQTQNGFRSYHLGNSLTDTINDWLDPIADSAGFNHSYLRSTIPGAPTQWIWDHPGQSLGERDYRTVFTQNAPIHHLVLQPFAGHGRSIAEEADYSGRFFALCRQRSPQVQTWLYIQWPDRSFSDSWSRATGHATGLGLTPASNWADAVRNHQRYIELIRQRLDADQPGNPIRIVPGGLALVRLQSDINAGRIPGITDFFATHFTDNLHLSPKGRYLVALVHFACFYQRSPVGLVTTANSTLTPTQARIYQTIAWDVARTYAWSGIP